MSDRPPRRPSQRPAANASSDTREKLMDLAEQISANKGPDAVTLGDVAHRAGLPVSKVEREFPTRADLLQAVFHRSTVRLRDLAFTLLAQDDDNDENRARSKLVRMFDLVSAPDRAPLFGAVVAAKRDPFPDAMERGLRQLGVLFHDHRRELFGTARSLKDTLYIVELTTIAMYGELALGDAARERLGLPLTSRERREFRRWFADKILELGRADTGKSGIAGKSDATG